MRKRQSGSSLAKTQRGGNRPDGDTAGRNAETVRDRFSSFAAGRQQAAEAAEAADATSSTPDEETQLT